MARLAEDRKKAIKFAIHEQLLLVGPKEWDTVLSRFPDISSSTFHRLVRETRDEITQKAATDSPEALRIAQQRVKSTPESIPKIQSETALQIPCSPSPAIIASKRDRGVAHLRVLSTIDKVMQDGELLREHSVVKNSDGTERIKNPMMFVQSARLRMDTAQGYMSALSQAYDMEKMQEFYAIIMDEIGRASPEVQHAILLRLKAANAVHAMTVDAEI